jgi:hypothetical protein
MGKTCALEVKKERLYALSQKEKTSYAKDRGRKRGSGRFNTVARHVPAVTE